MRSRKVKKAIQVDLWGNPIEEKRPTREIVLADFGSETIRIVFIKGEPWFVLTDVARVLGYGSAKDAGRILRDKHKGRHSVPTPGGEQEQIIITETGLYRLMMRSDRPEAEEFQDWVTEDVLPSIRKTGTYLRKGSRVDRLTKKLKTTDPSVLMGRVDQINKNKEINSLLASEGACPRDFQALHNACYRGQVGAEAKQLRAELGLKGYQTPLDHMGGLALAQNHHAKLLAQKQIQEAPGPVPIEERCQIMEETARYIAESDFAKLGHRFEFGVVEDDERGRIIDVVRKGIEAD